MITLAVRVGADLCVRPRGAPIDRHGGRSLPDQKRAHTQVRPYPGIRAAYVPGSFRIEIVTFLRGRIDSTPGTPLLMPLDFPVKVVDSDKSR